MLKPFSDKVAGVAPSAIREILKFTSDPEVISFAAGNPAPETFPVETIAKLSADIFAKEPISALQYSVTEGYMPLRKWLENDLRNKKMFAENDNVIVTAGAQQAIETTAKILCNEGDVILCEDPSFVGSLNAFRSYGVRLIGIPTDDDGFLPEKLEEVLEKEPNVKFIYTIPNFRNPTGTTTSLERRKTVLELAKKYSVYILEDNPYGDLRFAGTPVANYKELDKSGNVIYAGTFSKTLAPGLRVGYLCADKELIAKAVVGLQTSTVHTNIWAQMIAYRFVTTVDFPAHLEKLRGVYRNKCKRMLDDLHASMPDCVTYSNPEGGLFIWATVPEKYDMNEFCRIAVQNKVAVVPGNAFLADESAVSHSFRLNYSTPTDEQLDKGTEILGKVASEFFK